MRYYELDFDSWYDESTRLFWMIDDPLLERHHEYNIWQLYNDRAEFVGNRWWWGYWEPDPSTIFPLDLITIQQAKEPGTRFVRSSRCLLRSGTGTGPLHSLDKSAAGDLNVLLILPILLTLILLLLPLQQQQLLLLLLLLLQLPGRPHRDIYDQRRYWQSIRPVAPPVAHKLHRLQILALHGTVFITHHTVDVVMQTVWATGYSNDMY